MNVVTVEAGKESFVEIVEYSNLAVTEHAVLIERALLTNCTSKPFIKSANLKEFD